MESRVALSSSLEYGSFKALFENKYVIDVPCLSNMALFDPFNRPTANNNLQIKVCPISLVLTEIILERYADVGPKGELLYKITSVNTVSNRIIDSIESDVKEGKYTETHYRFNSLGQQIYPKMEVDFVVYDGENALVNSTAYLVDNFFSANRPVFVKFGTESGVIDKSYLPYLLMSLLEPQTLLSFMDNNPSLSERAWIDLLTMIYSRNKVLFNLIFNRVLTLPRPKDSYLVFQSLTKALKAVD